MDLAEKPATAAGNEIDRPIPSAPSNRVWGSDAIAAVLRELDIPYIALNPGASYRGIHDSLVNYLGNTPAHALVPARGECRRLGARLRQGHRAADGDVRAQQCRADA